MVNESFWCPAPEPTGEELEKIIFLTFLRNIFSTQNASANREVARMERKRHRLYPQKRKGDNYEESVEAWEEEKEVGPLVHIIASLVHSAGVPYASSLEDQDTAASAASLVSVEVATSGNTLQPATEVSHERDSAETTKVTQKPRSALATLVESARLKEKLQKIEHSETKTDILEEVSLHHSPCRGATVNFPFEGRDNPLASNQGGDDFGVALPLRTFTDDGGKDSLHPSENPVTKHPSQMSQEEFLRQFKRAPRRGEIGYDAESVAAAEAVGYVMSGSRNKEKQHYVDSIQRKLHEKEARKLRLQFRKVEDERSENTMIQAILAMVNAKRPNEDI
ncbi:hypothetical protein TraAM80_06880 [Trypanosoma rangeli]|uniref:NF-kappa-B-activating protein C-terminal domain-containing protein n=1 Tax=Trypanosoma rangeli TaxID=5698 RepID=A0A422N868_TRYRA|nr:uncharacterized protein TraAM80_06880 [Trypanosoma rangeli]RNF01647.1 hypothetical protein TraAM80_06880 [Trypanosoma rangeli]|eukprot:RNF01647.1 hypothetical protein TraAM80_06880 [Trypanosoma rangeli]